MCGACAEDPYESMLHVRVHSEDTHEFFVKVNLYYGLDGVPQVDQLEELNKRCYACCRLVICWLIRIHLLCSSVGRRVNEYIHLDLNRKRTVD